jgi:hypothetical protein
MHLRHSILKRLLPLLDENRQRRLKYVFEHHIPRQNRRYRKIVRRIRRKGQVNVLFIASSLPMWRFDELYRLMKRDSRMNVGICIRPFAKYRGEEYEKCRNALTDHFKSEQFDFECIEEPSAFDRLKAEFKPDIIFYPQPYDGCYDNSMEWRHNLDCLLVYVPYGLTPVDTPELLNNGLVNYAWKHYVQYPVYAELAERVCNNLGRNVVVTGDFRRAELTYLCKSDPWKKTSDGKRRKRIIWAPHFQIFANDIFNRPDVLWVGETMLRLAEKYTGSVQFAFKPHPSLFTELCKHPDWGIERTREFYRQWAEMPNTQLETGEYTDLFKTSDAMIHNCGSFACEYLYVDKPVLFTARDRESTIAPLNRLGRECIDAHYFATNPDEIEAFITEVVIGGNDTLSSRRESLMDSQTFKVGNGSQNASEAVYKDILASLRWPPLDTATQ